MPSTDQHVWTRRKVNLPPNITTPSVRYALLGEDLQLQLEGEDPESRPFVISMIDGNPSHAKLSASHILYWKPETQNSTNFFFRATDECNASSTFNMTIEVVIFPCTEKGICEPNPGHPRGSGMYVCKCQPGYEGQRCEKEIDECLLSPCVRGTCNDEINNYTCTCDPGYTGYNCSVDIDECQSSPCIHVFATGNCSDLVNGFNCSFQSGFNGTQCEHNIDDCPSSGCGNGTCVDLVNNYTCQCNVGFRGQRCGSVIRNCSSDACFPGVRCIQITNTITCDPCPTGYFGDGKNCKDIDDCINVTCKNGGSCKDGINNYTCSCQLGYTGNWCETDIDDCVSARCENNATCVDGVNQFSCVCQTGFSGKLCDIDVDDCVSARCANGAKCVDGVNQYNCVCQPGFTGELCDQEVTPTITTVGKTEINSTLVEHKTTEPPTEPETDELKSDFKFEIRIKREWDSSLEDSSSKKFKELSNLLKKEIYKAYSGFPDLKEVKIIGMRPGSIIADFQLIFKRALSAREASGPLAKEIKDGKLGNLEVDPNSLKTRGDKEDPTSRDEEGKKSIYVIIGVCCGVFLLILVVVYMIRYCKRRLRHDSCHVTDRMPNDNSFPNNEKYELQNTKEDIVGCEEIAISSPGADYEENTKRKEDHNPKENPHREKVGFPNDAKNDQEIGITNEAVCRDEEGTLSDVDND